MMGYIMLECERFGLGYHIYQRLVELKPDHSDTWLNMGMCLESIHIEKALECFNKALKLNPDNYKALANVGLVSLLTGNPKRCIHLCKQALAKDPNILAATHNMGLAQLMIKDWSNGWANYFKTLGVKHRKQVDYRVPEWKGEKGTVLVYGEQGVGDEMLYASCIPDLLKTNKVIIDSDKRLESLFKRSFDVPVFGTRFDKDSPIMAEKFDYSCAIGQLPYFFRRNGEFPGNAYLKVDPERSLQWRALFDSLPGKKIGIAWNGGLPSTGAKKRSLTIEDFEPLFNKSDTFISLDYLETNDKLKCYPEVMKGRSIDDMAPLVAELDYIVSCTTTVVHLAGALGTKCYTLVPTNAPWIFGDEGGYDWSDSVELIRQRKGEKWYNVVSRTKQIINPLRVAI